MPVHSTLTIDEGLHTLVKMVAAARRQSVNTLIADFLVRGVTDLLREDPQLVSLIRTLIERDGVEPAVRRSVLRLLEGANGY